MRFIVSLSVGCLASVSTLGAATWEGQGVRPQVIDLCFVGDGLSQNPTRVQEIRALLPEFTRAINVRLNDLGTCPAPTTLANGNADYGSSIRIRVSGSNISDPATGKIAGKGCQANQVGSSFAMFPSEAEANRSCVYNVQIWDDADAAGVRYRNHPLHELGHALGLRHEHIRADAVSSSGCSDADFGGNFTDGYLTGYDRFSVMNYFHPNCGISGNYGHQGLSAGDILGLRILYPDAGNTARYFGRLLVRQGEPVQVYGGWSWLGGDAQASRAFNWWVDGASYGQNPGHSWVLSPGNHQVVLQYSDLIGRTFSSSFSVTVLTPDQYRRKVIAPIVSPVL